MDSDQQPMPSIVQYSIVHEFVPFYVALPIEVGGEILVMTKDESSSIEHGSIATAEFNWPAMKWAAKFTADHVPNTNPTFEWVFESMNETMEEALTSNEEIECFPDSENWKEEKPVLTFCGLDDNDNEVLMLEAHGRLAMEHPNDQEPSVNSRTSGDGYKLWAKRAVDQQLPIFSEAEKDRFLVDNHGRRLTRIDDPFDTDIEEGEEGLLTNGTMASAA